ncbi:MAG: two-component sensor histidine kinase [Acidimicrobiia bacterium]|nr:MAG: two-component sensor histidine kinase [Acidimicrobiia bacterium]
MTLPGDTGSHPILRNGDEWFAAEVAFDEDTLPADLKDETDRGEAARQRVRVGDETMIAVGIPLGEVDATYFELFPLGELERTLETLGWSLLAAASITTVLGALVGAYASRQVLRPLRGFAAGAAEIAQGHLDTRLRAPGDKDLAPIATSFNDMAEALQRRVEREAQFASDVAHELRTPLTALSAAVDVLDRRADERTKPALDVLRDQVRRFEQLVLDLLEISRFDVGVAELTTQVVAPPALVASILSSLDRGGVPLDVAPTTPASFRLDKRRVERMLANLLENADLYAGGAVRVECSGSGDRLRIAVEDAGPGIPPEERAAVFERFHRLRDATSDGARGTGLGLALVAEHAALHGGDAYVEDRPGRRGPVRRRARGAAA